ncbi:MAG: OmpH family outer membrane protein [Planctomycetes bacterium]|nr:OmpH family outer membrane protein [Planctomycetota bacterium]
MKHWLLISAVLVACSGALALTLPQHGWADNPAARDPRRSLKIAVVDMMQILENYKKTEAIREDVKAAIENRNHKLQEMSTKGQDLMKELQTGELDPASKEYKDREAKLFQLDSYAKVYRSSAEKEIQRQNMKIMVELNNDIQDVVKLFCEKNGFTIVMRVDNGARSVTDPAAAGRVVNQDVLYHKASEDITAPVLAYLNKRYEASAAKADAEKASPATDSPAAPTATKGKKSK